MIAFIMLMLTGSACGQQNAEDWCNKSNALYEQGKYDEAILAYDEAIRMDPQYIEAWYNKGAALEALGRDTQAQTAFAKARELGFEV